MITKNTTSHEGDEYLTVSFYDCLHAKEKPKDNRTPEEITRDIIKKAGLEVVG